MGDLVSRVHEMAASFVKYKTREFLTSFLHDSGIAEDLYKNYVEHVVGVRVLSMDEFCEKLVQDYFRSFGQCLGLAYALGYDDHKQGRTITQLYVPKSCADTDDERQLILPGIMD